MATPNDPANTLNAMQMTPYVYGAVLQQADKWRKVPKGGLIGGSSVAVDSLIFQVDVTKEAKAIGVKDSSVVIDGIKSVAEEIHSTHMQFRQKGEDSWLVVPAADFNKLREEVTRENDKLRRSTAVIHAAPVGGMPPAPKAPAHPQHTPSKAAVGEDIPLKDYAPQLRKSGVKFAPPGDGLVEWDREYIKTEVLNFNKWYQEKSGDWSKRIDQLSFPEASTLMGMAEKVGATPVIKDVVGEGGAACHKITFSDAEFRKIQQHYYPHSHPAALHGSVSHLNSSALATAQTAHGHAGGVAPGQQVHPHHTNAGQQHTTDDKKQHR